MLRPTERPLNRLRDLPEGILVDAAWLKNRGYSRQLLSHYVRTGWLEQPARGVYRRPRGHLTWQQVVISLQSFLDVSLAIGGRTALELHGYAHYLPQSERPVDLYGPTSPPGWLGKLALTPSFNYHNSEKLFRAHGATSEFEKVLAGDVPAKDALDISLTELPWGPWDWKLILATPERALLELLDELPNRETFHQVDMLMQGMANLSPRRLKKLLVDCKSVKVKRLFFFFADRHGHAWRKPLKHETFDLGTGKRLLVKGGKLDHTYQITVPKDLNGVS